MKLFDIVESKVVLNADELSIPVFKKIYDDDKTKGKDIAFKEISYVVFMYRWNSPYIVYLNDDIRSKILKQDLFNDSEYQLSENVKLAESRFKDFQNTLSVQFLQSNIDSIKKLMDYNNRVNWDDTDKTGRLLYSNKDLGANIEKAGNMLKSLLTLMEQVRKEELETTKTRGGNEVNSYEDIHSIASILK